MSDRGRVCVCVWVCVALWRSITASAIDFLSNPRLVEYDLSSLESIGGGGAQMPEAVARKLKELTGLDFGELKQADPLANISESEALDMGDTKRGHRLNSFSDIRL